mgnify:CR=1 FL=1
MITYSMPQSMLSTLLHLLELAVILALVWVISKVFHVSSEQTQGVILMVLAGLAKFARSSDSVPVADYVNGQS